MTFMTGRWSRALQRATTVTFASAVGVLLVASPALADATILIKDAHVPTTAEDFEPQICSGQTPAVPGMDGWHFVLPAEGAPNAEFTEVRLTFEDDEGDPHDVLAVIGQPTNKHAVVYTPAGWTLIAGEADITGEEGDVPSEFNLSHTCPAPKGSPSPTPSDSKSPSPTPSESESPSESPSGSETPSEGPSESDTSGETPGASVSPTTPGGPGGLPVTGLALTGLIVTGLGMVGAGAAMRALRRRNDVTEADDTEAGDEPSDV